LAELLVEGRGARTLCENWGRKRPDVFEMSLVEKRREKE